MNTRRNFLFYFLHLLFILKLAIISRALNGSSSPCANSFSCGSKITGIRYPFRGFSDPPYCSHPNFVLTCDYEKNGITNIEITGMKYRVLAIDQISQTMTIAREDVMEEACPTEIKNTTLDYSTFDIVAVYTNITFLYGCPPSNNFKDFVVPLSCNGDGGVYVSPGNSGPGNCRESVIVPFPGKTRLPNNITEFDRITRKGFLVTWKYGSQTCVACTGSRGRCEYSLTTNETVCYCRGSDTPHVPNTSCPLSDYVTPPSLSNGNKTSPPKTIISIGT